ncbi:hypothetical protein VR45_16230 [Streptomyces sp. NRRL S-495]|nr:hypothetical protein VR45_16230 [Streptomyces sp. NRRL S-495]
MAADSVARRSWRSFTGGTVAHRPLAGARAREGYTLRQRLWASFIGADLPAGPLVAGPLVAGTVSPGEPAGNRNPEPEAARDRSRSRPIAPGWFSLPQLPRAGGLAAAGGDTPLLEAASPDGTARFLVRSHGIPPGYSLELVVHGVEGTVPLMTVVEYSSLVGPEQVLLVPVVRGRFGPAASYVRLPGFGGEGWRASVTAPVGPDSTWDGATVALSVGAALNDATRDTWRQVRALITDVGLRRVIDQELR